MPNPKDLIDRLSRSLEPADPEPFQRAAEAALAAIPPAMTGTIHRTVEEAWVRFFKPLPLHESTRFLSDRASSRNARH
jgi:hypothetical protein